MLIQRLPSTHAALLAFAQDLGYSFAPKAQREGSAGQTLAGSVRNDQRNQANPMLVHYWEHALRRCQVAVSVVEATLEEIVSTTGYCFIEEYAPKLILARDAKQMLSAASRAVYETEPHLQST